MSAATTTFKFAQGLETTLRVLTKTNNEAALDVLAAALDSPHQVIQEGALTAILERRSHAGQREVLKRLHLDGPRWRHIIEALPGCLSLATEEALLGKAPQLCANACQAILWLRQYDAVGVLLAVLEDDTHRERRLAAETLVALADLLVDDYSTGTRDDIDRRHSERNHQRMSGSLESAVRRFGQHECDEVIHAFLLVTNRDNVTLRQIVHDPRHPAFVCLLDALLHSQRPGVIQLLLSFLDDPRAPSAAISALARRDDAKFMHALLRHCGLGEWIPLVAAENLKRAESLAWLRVEPAALDQLDESLQSALVRLTVASSVRRREAFQIVEYLAVHGKPAGRLAAVKALAHFGAEAAALLTQALDDCDPRVEAAALQQMRTRGTPGALVRLIEMIDSPHELVRQAARESLPEFRFSRYMAAFDMLDRDVRRTIGRLVKKTDPNVNSALAVELRARSRSRRLRALAIVEAMGDSAGLENVLVELLGDVDPLVRVEAARALARSDSTIARHALRDALADHVDLESSA